VDSVWGREKLFEYAEDDHDDAVADAPGGEGFHAEGLLFDGGDCDVGVRRPPGGVEGGPRWP
jgi:hypothetical protein